MPMQSSDLPFEQFAPRVDLSEKTVRRKLDKGETPGAYRVGRKGAHWKSPCDAEDKITGRQ
jgi:hypothetical protein